MAKSDKARAAAKKPPAADVDPTTDLNADLDAGEEPSPDGEAATDPDSGSSENDSRGSVALPDEERADTEDSVGGPDERRSADPDDSGDSGADVDPDQSTTEPVDEDTAATGEATPGASPDTPFATPDSDSDPPAEAAPNTDAGTRADPAEGASSGAPTEPAPSGFNGRPGWTSAVWIPEPEDLSSGAADTSSATGGAPDPSPAFGPLPGGTPDLIPAEPEGTGVTVTETERPDPGRPTKAVRRAHLTLSRIEPWSVMKFSFIISLVCFIILFVAVTVVYVILDTLGVFDAMTELITSLTESSDPEDSFEVDPAAWFSAARVFGFTALVGALNVILITALSTVGAMLYNLAADLVGGLDITLSESE